MQHTDLLDTRPEAAFAAGHHLRAAGIPLEELPARVHELPAPGEALLHVFDVEPARLAAALAFLGQRGFQAVARSLAPSHLTERGPADARLWSPSPLLEEVMKSNSPPPGPALDLGCGAGRDAVYMALRGFDVTAVDVLPDAVARAGDLAARCRVSVQPCILDLRRLPLPFPAGHYALVTVFRYLHRPLLPLLPPMLRPGGLLLVETFHERCRDTAAGPHSPERLLRSGELTAAFAPMNILIAEDGVERRGRFFSRIVAAAR